MLLQFSVKNFRSFKGEQFITMVPAKIKGHEQNIANVSPGLGVLKSAVVYGANASGKSNFIKAITTLANLIRTSSDKKPKEPFEEYEPFKLAEETLDKPVVLTIDFFVNSLKYHYEVEFSKENIEKEKLTFYPHRYEALIFERVHGTYRFGEYFRGPKKFLMQITANNQLFLSKASVNNVKLFTPIFEYFNSYRSNITKNGVYVPTWMWEPFMREELTEELNKNKPGFVNKINKLISVFDTGIESIEMKEKKSNVFGWDFSNTEIYANHKFSNGGKKGNLTRLKIEEESTGTQKLLAISVMIIKAFENGSVVFFDEIGSSLHPYISRFIINLFNNPKINKNNAQLIAATHDATLLSEETNLRRDQIWIVEKDDEGASELFSLADMKGVRDNVPFEKWYLSGRFGGVPNIEGLQLEFDNAR